MTCAFSGWTAVSLPTCSLAWLQDMDCTTNDLKVLPENLPPETPRPLESAGHNLDPALDLDDCHLLVKWNLGRVKEWLVHI